MNPFDLDDYHEKRGKVSFNITNEDIMDFFTDIQGKFLERDSSISLKEGRPDTSFEFSNIQRVWTLFTDKTIKQKNQDKVMRDEMSDYFDAAMLFDLEHIGISDVAVYQPLRNRARAPDNVSI